MIYSITTHNITVSVESTYEIDASKPSLRKHVHSYRVTITNNSGNTVQLLRRKWYIKNTENETKIIEGEGVIGLQPILAPDEVHQYQSWSILTTAIGMMSGHYQMLNTLTDEMFLVDIPEFDLVAPFTLN
jgi:ApaG protein